MNISVIAHRYTRVVLALVVVVCLFGFASYFLLPAQEDPEILIREAVITTRYPGLPASQIELLITKELEEAVRQVPELEEIRSVSMPGTSIIYTQVYDRYFDLDQIWDDVRDQVDQAIPLLPAGTQTPMINDTFGDVAVITAALTSASHSMAQKRDIAEHIRDVLLTIEGAQRVDVLGVQEERIFLEYNNARLAQLGITPDQLGAILRRQNIIQPGGRVDAGNTLFYLQPSGNFESIAELENALIAIPGRQESILLRDVLDIKTGYEDPPRQTSYFNGRQAVMFAITKTEEVNVLDFTPRVLDVFDQLRRELPVGYELEIATRQAEQVENAVYGVTLNVIQTIVIVLAVVIVFLGLRTGLIVGLIIPAVMLVTLAVMNVAGLALERMSLATLVISLGLLVDNAIVVADDFKRRLEEGETRDEALRNSGKTLTIPLLTSSLTTILVFLPLMLAQDVSGEYTRSISLVILITLLASWIMAMTVTPLLCFHFIKLSPNRRSESLFEKISRPYAGFLRRLLARRGAFMLVMVALLIGSGAAFQLVPSKFFPDSDRAQILMYVDLPTGTSMRTTDAALRDVFPHLDDRARFPHIESYAAYAGFGGPRFVLSLTPIDPMPNKAFIVANIDGQDHMDGTVTELRTMFRDEFPAMRARVSRMFLGPSDSNILEVQIQGPDADYVYATGREIAETLRSIPGTIDVHTDWENRITRLEVDVNQQKARRAGVTSLDVANALETAFSGQAVTEFRDGDDVIPVILRLNGDQRFDLSRIEAVNVFGRDATVSVPMAQVAEVIPIADYARIHREDLFRTVTVQARNVHLAAEDMVPLLEPDLERMRATLPANHRIEFDGVVIDSSEGQAAIAANVPLVLSIITILLITQFNSFRRAGIIMMTIPLILIGAVVGLLVMRAEFGFMVTLGLYSLAGIIINNAIVMIDYIDTRRREGESGATAVIEAARVRLRPIIMSTATTIVGLFPLIVTRDPLFYGMAVVMAFGLAVGTVLTLGVVPVLYGLFFGIRSGSPKTV